jgi:hypothetical protein
VGNDLLRVAAARSAARSRRAPPGTARRRPGKPDVCSRKETAEQPVSQPLTKSGFFAGRIEPRIRTVNQRGVHPQYQTSEGLRTGGINACTDLVDLRCVSPLSNLNAVKLVAQASVPVRSVPIKLPVTRLFSSPEPPGTQLKKITAWTRGERVERSLIPFDEAPTATRETPGPGQAPAPGLRAGINGFSLFLDEIRDAFPTRLAH